MKLSVDARTIKQFIAQIVQQRSIEIFHLKPKARNLFEQWAIVTRLVCKTHDTWYLLNHKRTVSPFLLI